MSQIICFNKINDSGLQNCINIGVISDTHIADSSKDLPLEVLEAFKQVDLVLHAGDIVGLGVIEQLKSVCAQVVAVAGNMDLEPVRKKYPAKQLLEIMGLRIGLMHGVGPAMNLPELLSEAFKDDHCDLIVFGHSHKPMNEKINAVLFFNPGSATDPAAAFNSYGIIQLKKESVASGLPGEQQFAIDARIIKIKNG